MGGNSDAYAAWEISAGSFPGHEADIASRLRHLVGYAVLAPSGYNRQPWKFRVTGGCIEVHADRARCLPVIDPDDRELVISCGSALFNMRIAARHFGYDTTVRLLPDPEQPDLLATLCLGAPKATTHEENVLFAAITKRRTNRQAFEPRKVDPVILMRLEEASMTEGAWVALLTKRGDRHAMAECIARGDRLQFADKRFRREVASWVHSGRSQSHDGMPAYAQGMKEIMTMAGSLAIRTFDLGKGVAAKDADLAEHSPLLGVMGTAEDDAEHWLRAGQALQRVLLLAAGSGISASFMNQPIEVEGLRPRVASLVGRTGHPQVVFRMGYGPEPPLMPRRGVGEVLR